MDLKQSMEILGDGFSFSAEDTAAAVELLNLPRDAKILDVGTGMGSMAITLALAGYHVLTGEPEDDDSIYANQDWLDNAKKVGVNHKIKFKALNALALPFQDQNFDAIFSLGSLHHIDENQRSTVIKELHRILKPHGIICFLEPNPKAVEMVRKLDPTHPDETDPTPYAQGTGMAIQTIKGRNFDTFILHPPGSRLGQGMMEDN
ncbi:MAG: class I SAM-dependent methyltransferase [Desulfobacterales bacterium]|nr:class I SAM-dependent methyltransferase [Desulfobacterales bacterium]